MNNIFLSSSLGYENVSINKIKQYKENIQKLNNNYNTLTEQEKQELGSIYDNLKNLNQTYTQISNSSGMATNEIKNFLEENEVISTSKEGDALNAVIFRNKKTNEVEITVGGTEGSFDLLEDAGIVVSGYSLTQSNKLNNLIQEAEEKGLITSSDKINFYGHSLGKGKTTVEQKSE